ncbi:hypothetical protein GCM10022243_58600 [Saccharothrix violaceirubra]|uniref:Nucleic acid/nucleotide deaminase of polymorphic system toxin n=1 Tax=Saccharothrix violaceirubra TaxID=413306 RepID=A0A7W7T369_9PSEU|nr:DddA-like double-stranded DNA deaminase toxin [Saccharothrix violaceirubra]MBB4965709.1 hypothetical protein [Saccharothrix violaceirubra]
MVTSVGDVAEQIGRAWWLLSRCRRELVAARDLAEAARTDLVGVLDGSVDIGPAANAFGAVLDRVAVLLADVDRLSDAMIRIRARLTGRLDATGPSSAAVDERTTTPDHLVESMRNSLPPRVTPRSGQKTHGRWLGPDGQVRNVVSGKDHRSELARQRLYDAGVRRTVAVLSDVEMKIAAEMAATGIRHATLVINHRVCRGDLSCDTLLPVLLPEGYTLTVHGIDRRGNRTKTRYTGGSTTW